MRLKLFVSAMILATVVVFAGWPIFVGPIPHRPATRAQIRQYSRRAIGAIGVLLVTVVAAGVGSLLIVRRAKAEYGMQSMQNMQSLIEGSMDDHRKKSQDSHDS